jgi:hypothetical protein
MGKMRVVVAYGRPLKAILWTPQARDIRISSCQLGVNGVKMLVGLVSSFSPKAPIYKLVLDATQTNLDRLDIYINTSLGKPRYVSAGSVIV